MIRNLKAMGLALVAVFAMSAMAAAAAQAENGEKADFWAAEANATIDAVGEGSQTFSFPGFPELTCVSGATPSVDGDAVLASESPELTSKSIQYTNCHVVSFGLKFPVTVDMNTCDFLFTAGTYTKAATGGQGASDGSVHINCVDPKDVIEITILNTNHLTHRCIIDVPPQTPEGTVTFNNETTEGAMAVTATADSLKVTSTITDTNTIGCNNHVHGVAIYKGSFWAKATNQDEEYIDTTVTGTAP